MAKMILGKRFTQRKEDMQGGKKKCHPEDSGRPQRLLAILKFFLLLLFLYGGFGFLSRVFYSSFSCVSSRFY